MPFTLILDTTVDPSGPWFFSSCISFLHQVLASVSMQEDPSRITCMCVASANIEKVICLHSMHHSKDFFPLNKKTMRRRKNKEVTREECPKRNNVSERLFDRMDNRLLHMNEVSIIAFHAVKGKDSGQTSLGTSTSSPGLSCHGCERIQVSFSPQNQANTKRVVGWCLIFSLGDDEIHSERRKALALR